MFSTLARLTLAVLISGYPALALGLAPISKTSLTNAPAPRSQHTAVAVGAKVFVWGGETQRVVGPGSYEFHLANDGAIYDPEADRWSSVSTVNAPSPRRNQFAQAVGSKVFIWGGCVERSGSGCLTQAMDGGIYDAATDSWEAIPPQRLVTFYEKSERSAWNSVVIGGDLYVFGLYGAYPHTGALRYRPRDHSWSQLTDPRDLYLGWDPSRIFDWNGQLVFWISGLSSLGLFDQAAAKLVTLAQARSTRESMALVGDEVVYAQFDDTCLERRPASTRMMAFDLKKRAERELPPAPRGGCWSSLLADGHALYLWGGEWEEQTSATSSLTRKTRELYRLDSGRAHWELLADDTHRAIDPIDYRSVSPVIAGDSLVLWGGDMISLLPLKSDEGVRIGLPKSR